jgi:hypothetical protein
MTMMCMAIAPVLACAFLAGCSGDPRAAREREAHEREMRRDDVRRGMIKKLIGDWELVSTEVDGKKETPGESRIFELDIDVVINNQTGAFAVGYHKEGATKADHSRHILTRMHHDDDSLFGCAIETDQIAGQNVIVLRCRRWIDGTLVLEDEHQKMRTISGLFRVGRDSLDVCVPLGPGPKPDTLEAQGVVHQMLYADDPPPPAPSEFTTTGKERTMIYYFRRK